MTVILVLAESEMAIITKRIISFFPSCTEFFAVHTMKVWTDSNKRNA